MADFLSNSWPFLVAALDVVVSLVASGHAVIRKRDARAAATWAALIWLLPFLGALCYWILGINRIKRRARSLRARFAGTDLPSGDMGQWTVTELTRPAADRLGKLGPLAKLVGRVVRTPLLHGNSVQRLENGTEAYPAMLDAIDSASRSVALSTFIFGNDHAGEMFAAALRRAVQRGVRVRVLIDDVGARYSWPTVLAKLRDLEIPAATFLPTLGPRSVPYSNLRNHRKILVVDGAVGFTGGMNIRAGNLLDGKSRHPVQDLHFRLAGPIVSALQREFVADWAFATDEILDGDSWFPDLEPAGSVVARGVPDGPDEDLDTLPFVLLGALASASRRVCIVTPYFLPDAALITALNVASMRGVQVDIVLPEKSNLRFVQWASQALLWQLLERGCRVWVTPPPFDHTKLMVVDGAWTFLGSANWDPRSLRLNFEFNVECYDRALAAELVQLVDRKIAAGRRVRMQEVEARGLATRLRDGVARLFSPFL